ncbi:MAG: cell division protein ZapA [Clostridia bacterium]|nr:cell division protein ZapA [Clostridia bacterium]MDD4048079.1 cell division protein ZapA [Clostridia bacterium]
MKQGSIVNKLSVMIYEDEYVIKGDADVKHIESVAACVDKQMLQIAERNPLLSAKQLAVLVAINVTDELMRLREDYNELVKLLDDTTGGNK